MNDDDLKKMIDNHSKSYDVLYEIMQKEVTYIIMNHIVDDNYIEHILDYIMGIYTEKGFDLFMQLIFYYQTINYPNALSYLEYIREDRNDEYKAYIKKISTK